MADLGGAIITGIHSNPLAVLARQLDIPMHNIRGDNKDVPLFLRDGSELDTKVEEEVGGGRQWAHAPGWRAEGGCTEPCCAPVNTTLTKKCTAPRLQEVIKDDPGSNQYVQHRHA